MDGMIGIDMNKWERHCADSERSYLLCAELGQEILIYSLCRGRILKVFDGEKLRGRATLRLFVW